MREPHRSTPISTPLQSVAPFPLRRPAFAAPLLLALSCSASLAQTGGASAADPSAASAPLVHQALEPSPFEPAPPMLAWKDANKAVASFPRGHADIVAWEAAQTADGINPQPHHGGHSTHAAPRHSATPPAKPPTAQSHRHHHGGRP